MPLQVWLNNVRLSARILNGMFRTKIFPILLAKVNEVKTFGVLYFLKNLMKPIIVNLSEEESIKDVSEFLNCNPEQLLIKARTRDTPEEGKLWRKKERKTKQDYRDYFAENIHSLERQDYYNRRMNLSFLYLLNKDASMLDYGCGTALVAFYAKLRRPDIKLSLADIPEAITKEFVFWRFKKYQIHFKWYDIDYEEELDFEEEYDFIRCHEVLEHVFHPDKVVKNLYSILKQGGLLSVDFVYDPDARGANTIEAQRLRPETLRFIENNFKILYKRGNQYLVKKFRISCC